MTSHSPLISHRNYTQRRVEELDARDLERVRASLYPRVILDVVQVFPQLLLVRVPEVVEPEGGGPSVLCLAALPKRAVPGQRPSAPRVSDNGPTRKRCATIGL